MILKTVSTLLFVLALLLTACTQPLPITIPSSTPQPPSSTADSATGTTPVIDNGCVENFATDKDYFPHKAAVTYAKGFTVEYFNNYKVVTVTNPYRDAEETFQYVLVQCGTPAPSEYENAELIEVPVKSIVSLSSRYLPLFAILARTNQIVGVDSLEGIYDPAVLEMAKDGQITEVGYGAEVNVEALIALEPDMIMTYAGRQAEANAHPKLLEAKLPVVINAEYMEPTPLGRAEWLKFVAAFFNAEDTANEYFDAIVTKYFDIAAQAQTAADKPSVFWGVPGKETWFMPGGDSFVAKLLKDAGANYLWSDDTSAGNMPLSFEAVFERAANADVWLAADGYPSLEEMLNADGRLSNFAAVNTGNIWSNDARINDTYGNDYWESGLANPDVVLADLLKIFHPELATEHELVYWRQLK